MKDYDKIKKSIALNDDKQAFRKFYEFYFEKLFTFSLRFLKSKKLSEEAISEIFVKVWQQRRKLLEIKNIDTYLYVLVKNHALNVIKKSLKHQNTHLSLNESHLEFAIENFTPEAAYFAEELRQEIDSIINSLPIACKNAFLLVKEDNLNYADAAEVLNISPFTVKNHVLKAMKRIREQLIANAGASEKVALLRNINTTAFIAFLIKHAFYFN